MTPRDRLGQSASRTCSVWDAPQQQEAAEQQRVPQELCVRSIGGLQQQLPSALHTLTRGATTASMPLKKTVAAERRMDLASFFCMIGRHGPAVALAVVAVVTVLAGFYIYRTVAGRRRKAACADGALGPGEEDGDASVIPRSRRRSGESTGRGAQGERCWAARGSEESRWKADPRDEDRGGRASYLKAVKLILLLYKKCGCAEGKLVIGVRRVPDTNPAGTRSPARL